jgi:hypothetical protein
MATITKIESQRRISVTGDPTSGTLPCVLNPGDVVYREDGALTYEMTDAGLVAATSMDASPVFTSAVIGAPGSESLAIGGPSSAASTVSVLTKAVGSIDDNTATAVLTATIPNSAISASLRVRLVGALGAAGAIGAREATGTVAYDIAITRTAGVNAVVTASSAYGSGMANVAGAATITVVAAASAISGAVDAVNTFTVNVTINSGSGVSANHTCLVIAELANAVASGVTIA